ncbi:hypothetical protein VWJ25_03465 [Escherichia coli O157]|uniref:Chromosome segregation protein n=2 Tax=root TaxID=1 RepID=A0A5A4U709_9CAUD|nr:hypothetical protein [Escherichia coli]MED6924268.1 hypothetical protein [Escherichia coli O157]QDF13666.1 chromosome segregation protein [Escherichia phage vB_EcoM_phAPEC6]BBM61773.1 hypothetical protein EO157G_1840 [Escherichia phage SP27]MDI1144026.1 hypothetical protein [Escherichia coli]
MPSNFTDKNGGNMAGHSDKWSERNRRPNSYQAGQGSRGSRNQGTGLAGKANAEAGEVKSTENMTELEKLRYVNSLGLLNATQKQRLADMEREEKEKSAPAKEEPKQEAPKAVNPVKELSDKLGKIFANKPQLIQGIVKELQSVPKEELKVKAQAVLDAMSGNTSTEPTEVFSTIMRALEGTQQGDVPAQEEVSLESVLKTFDSIGKEDRANAQQVKNVLAKLENRLEGKDDKIKLVSDAVNDALKSYVQGEKSRFVTAMDAAFNTMKKYEADHGEKVTRDGYLMRDDEEGAVEQNDVHSDEEIDDMEAELSQDRQMTEKSHNELQKLMQWVADVGEKAGADKKSINRNLSWIKDKVGNNARKLQKAWTDVVNGAVDIDVESGEAYDYALTTLDDSFRDYENGNVTPWEKDIMSKYGK